MDAHHDKQLPESTQNAAADHRHHGEQGVDRTGHRVGNGGHDGAHHQQGQGEGDAQHHGGNEHELQNLGNQFLGQLFDLAAHEHGQQDGQDGLLVAQHGDRNAEEGQRGFGAHKGCQVRVQHGSAQAGGGVGVHAEDLAGGEADDDGEEVHQGVGRGVEDHVGAVGGSQHAEGGQDGQHTFDDTAGSHGGDAGDDAAGNGLEEAVVPAVLAHNPHAFSLGLAGGHGVHAAQQFFHFGAQVFHLGADGNLVLSAAMDHTHDALDLLHILVLDDALVSQHKAQPGHAMGHTDNIFLATHSGHDLSRKLRVIRSCHVCFLQYGYFFHTSDEIVASSPGPWYTGLVFTASV